MKITINGTVKAVQEPKTFASGFTVCDVLIEAGSNIYGRKPRWRDGCAEFSSNSNATRITI